MNKRKVQIGLKLDSETAEILEKYAAAKKWYRAQTARILLEEYLESKEVQQVIEEYNRKEKEVKE